MKVHRERACTHVLHTIQGLNLSGVQHTLIGVTAGKADCEHRTGGQ